jgi:hypothetical protein
LTQAGLQHRKNVIEPKFSFRQFFDFRFGVKAIRFFNLPHPIQTLHNLRDPRCPSRNSLLPLNVRVFFLDVNPQLVVVLLLNLFGRGVVRPG